MSCISIQEGSRQSTVTSNGRYSYGYGAFQPIPTGWQAGECVDGMEDGLYILTGNSMASSVLSPGLNNQSGRLSSRNWRVSDLNSLGICPSLYHTETSAIYIHSKISLTSISPRCRLHIWYSPLPDSALRSSEARFP